MNAIRARRCQFGAFVRSYGGRALAISFVDGYSTTKLVEKIRSR